MKRKIWRGRAIWRGAAYAAAMAAVLMGASGCHHKKNAAQNLPPQALPPAESAEQPPATRPAKKPLGRIPVTPLPPGGVSDDDLDFIATHRPILHQEGYATWYTAPYRGRKAANGELFDERALTAANRTLPMGSLIVVTNLKTGESSPMRISDRGPFVEGRILDLTIASAKAVGVYRAGLVRVRMDVYRTPKPIDTGGRWCVQIGYFAHERAALQLKQELLDRYPSATVIMFPGEIISGARTYWVRIRPEGDDRKAAESIERHLEPEEGNAFLTRLD